MTNLVATPASVPVPTSWNSLERLRAGLVLLFILDAFFLVTMLAAERTHRQQLQTVGRDSAPSIIAAQQIKVAVADMDAEAANELLAKPGAGSNAVQAYNVRREEAAEALISAAQNITYGDAERIPIKQLQVGLGEYEITIQKARDLHDRNDPQAITVYRQASNLVEKKLFPAADALDKANDDVLEDTFESGRSLESKARSTAAFAGLILFGLLLYLQWDLTKRVRRLINPGLFAATILTLALISFSNRHLSAAAENLRVARQDAFTSLNALWQARAVAYSANADESKFLLPAADDSDEKAFVRKADSIWSNADPHSYLQQESTNITFPGEREAAEETVRAWKAYVHTDSQIRQLRRAGKQDEAVSLCLGRNPGQSDWQFAQFDGALQKTIDINQQAFDHSVAAGFAQMNNFALISYVGAALIAICFAAGLLVRIREFL